MLGLSHVRGGVYGRLDAGGVWATPLVSEDPVKFCAATRGRSWYLIDSMKEPQPFEAGDVLVVNAVAPLRMGNDPTRLATASDPCPEPDADGAFQYGRGSEFSMLSGGVRIAHERRTVLQHSLPTVIHVRSNSPEATPLAWLVAQLTIELSLSNGIGQNTTLSALTQLLLVHALRAHLASTPTDGWLRVFAHAGLSRALAAMHTEPARPWRLEELSHLAGMSRTAFATSFRAVMGAPPISYLARHRMDLATRSLEAGRPVAEVAAMAGYASEPAFRHAYQHVTGRSPGAARRLSTKHDTHDRLKVS